MIQTEALVIFLVIVCALLALDLGVFNKKEHIISTKEALVTTCFWVFIALCFNVLIYFAYKYQWFGLTPASTPRTTAVEFFTGYIIELSLSFDNVFVIAMLFSYFNIPQQYQHRVLFWGILGAIVFRGIMIVIGAALVQKFDWIMYVFGALLIFSALKMIFGKNEEFDADKNKIVQALRKLYPISNNFDGSKFFTFVNGQRALTPMMVALVIIEATDVLFAIDSIPAIFVVTRDPFIVITSNIFAILGLRSMYFVLVSMINKFHYLQKSLIVLLFFIGIKMLLSHVVHIPIYLSLLIILLILLGGVLLSVLKGTNEK
ncbi:MAG: TerC family protein [Bacteroidales bacterium]|jgi:tellurite resistance protein TerC|nr:TerC family protein [Bacteroidales bacterium]